MAADAAAIRARGAVRVARDGGRPGLALVAAFVISPPRGVSDRPALAKCVAVYGAMLSFAFRDPTSFGTVLAIATAVPRGLCLLQGWVVQHRRGGSSSSGW